MIARPLGLCCVVFLLAGTNAMADNWGHWRGDEGNGVSTTATPPTHWSPTENILWKAPIDGAGSGSPIVWEQQVFVVTAVPVGDGALDFRVLCFDRRTGKPQWQQTATRATPHQGIHETNTHASASPCTDGQYVYAHFGSRGLYAYTMAGQLAWKRDDFPPMDTRLAFGEGSSPTIAGDRLLVPYDHEGQSWLAALDRHTGKTLWQIERDEPTNWATPLIVSHEGRQQVIMNGENYVRSYDLATGEELWRCGGQTQRPVASPVANDEMVFVGSGFRGSFLAAFRLGGEGDIRGSDQVVWTIQRDTPDIASLLLSENRLYFHKQKSGILTCVDASTGQKHFGPQRIPELRTIYASPIAAGGHVYVTGRDGTTVVIKDQPRFEIVATNSVGEGVDATPAPVDNQLFIRGNQHLFCIQAAD